MKLWPYKKCFAEVASTYVVFPSSKTTALWCIVNANKTLEFLWKHYEREIMTFFSITWVFKQLNICMHLFLSEYYKNS